MTEAFHRFIALAKKTASQRGLTWEMETDERGSVLPRHVWDLSAIHGSVAANSQRLTQMGPDKGGLERLNRIREAQGVPPLAGLAPPAVWQDLIKATAIFHVVIKRKKAGNAAQMIQALRLLAAEAGDVPPWNIDRLNVQRGYNASLSEGSSGKVALNFQMTIRSILDHNSLCSIPDLARYCEALPSTELVAAHKKSDALRRRESGYASMETARARLEDRRSGEKLPERQAFWNLLAVVLTMEPRTFSDHIRFEALRTLIVTGFRVNEAVNLPYDWQRVVEFFDSDGVLAGLKGGVSRALRVRHFAEKQEQQAQGDGLALWEEFQDVPKMFEDLLLEGLGKVSQITSALRSRLEQQSRTGRIFPEYPPEHLMPAWETYVRLTGNATFSTCEIPPKLIADYTSRYDLAKLQEIRRFQLASSEPFRPVLVYFSRLQRDGFVPRDDEGHPVNGRKDWRHCYFRVAELEGLLASTQPTKSSDLSTFRLSDGQEFRPSEFMFLMPIRNVVEGRNGGILDVELYRAVGRLSSTDLVAMLDGSREDSLYHRYEAENAETLKITPHVFRHLQTTELERRKVSDILIAKRFNRTSVAQNEVYNHPSLSEDLESLAEGSELINQLSSSSREILRLIEKKAVVGPIQRQFESIRNTAGDEAAFRFLATEADGLHVTPFGLCTNSFTGEPCPRQLECFDDCNSLMRTDDPVEEDNLRKLKTRTELVIEAILKVPENRRGPGWKNQLNQALRKLEGTVAALATKPGAAVFPNGRDLSRPVGTEGGSVLDYLGDDGDDLNDEEPSHE
ncbi:hypothetical protein [Agrobacterium tumefaciens]|uniref:hypothetical protein n=1 Tax=Agrobacterium tumefaciens TaxID=358 RepID=UPI0039A4DC6F